MTTRGVEMAKKKTPAPKKPKWVEPEEHTWTVYHRDPQTPSITHTAHEMNGYETIVFRRYLSEEDSVETLVIPSVLVARVELVRDEPLVPAEPDIV
jgi:hypothetical protein